MAAINLTNLFINGSAEANVTGLTGYMTNQNGAQSALTMTRVAKPANPTHDEWGSWVFNQGTKTQGVVSIEPTANITTVIGHKYYIRAQVRLRGSTAGAVTQFNFFHRVAVNGTTIALPGRGSNLQTIANTVDPGLYSTNITGWELVDCIWTADRTAFKPALVWAKTSNGNDDQYGQADNIMVINLTSVFGAGNEPPIQAVRGGVLNYTQRGYWDGTAAIEMATPPVFVTDTIPFGLTGRPYSATIEMEQGHGTQPFSFALSGLPVGHGLSINSSGAITGAITGAINLPEGEYFFDVVVTDAVGYQVRKTFDLDVGEPPVIHDTFITGAVHLEPYLWSPNVTGSAPLNITMVVSSGTLPSGLTIDNIADTISGTPTVDGQSCQITITATNEYDLMGVTRVLTLVVASTPTINTTSPLPNGILNQSYSATLNASGAQPITWENLNDLPPGLSLNPNTGQITGTPTATGVYSFGMRAVNYLGDDIRVFQLTVNQLPVITTSGTLSYGRLNSAYSYQIQATGTTPITFSQSGGQLPTGLTLNSNGTITGIPLATGVFTFQVYATNAAGSSAIVSLTIETGMALAIVTTSPLRVGTQGVAYGNLQFTAVGQDTTYTSTWAVVTAGTLPPGMSLSTAGILSGTPNTAGSYNFQVRVTNGTTQATSSFVLEVGTPPVITSNPTLLGGIDRPFTTVLQASGQTPITWAMTVQPNPPANITLDTNGVLSWLIPVTGSYTFTIQATNIFGSSAQVQFTLTITTPSIIDGQDLSNGILGEVWSYKFTARGDEPINWTVASGQLPPGLTFVPDLVDTHFATLSGVPTTVGPYNFRLQVQNFGGSANEPFTIIVYQRPFIQNTDLNSGNVSASYIQNLTATGSTPFTWVILPASGGETGLPPGLNLVGAAISGTPTTEGTYTFSVRCSNVLGLDYAHIKQFTITIGPSGAPVITTGANLTAIRGTAYSLNLAANGNTPITWSTISSLPNGITLVNNVLSGTPTVAGVYSFTITATNANGTDNRLFIMTIGDPVVITTMSLPNGLINVYYSYTLQATGDLPITWNVNSGSLPTGITLNPTTGTIYGTTSLKGTFTVGIRAVNGSGSNIVVYNLNIGTEGGLWLKGKEVESLFIKGKEVAEAYRNGLLIYQNN